jgi:hypothetical protein
MSLANAGLIFFITFNLAYCFGIGFVLLKKLNDIYCLKSN